MEYKELKQKSIGDLQKLLQKYREDLRTTRFKISATQEKDVKKISKIKKQVARIMMLMSQKKLEGKNTPIINEFTVDDTVVKNKLGEKVSE